MAKTKSLSQLDKEMLQILLSPNGGKETSRAIAKSLNIPATTIQRHRRRLESEMLTMNYGLDLKIFGLHKVHFFVSTGSGKTMTVAKDLAKLKQVVSVERSIGQQTIDLHMLTIVEDNADILEMMEMVKGMEGVKDVIWSETVQVVSRKSSIPPDIIEKL